MRSVNALSIAEFCARQYESRSCALMRGIDLSRDPLEDLDLSEAPEYLHKQIRDVLKTHSSMWDGTLGVIRATEHTIVTPPDVLPIRAQPYRTGPFKRQIISDQINKMLKLNVLAPSVYSTNSII